MNPEKSALILMGYQNDYFSTNGALQEVIEEPSKVTHILANTIHLLTRLAVTPTLIVATPIFFTPHYPELNEPIGILKTIKEVGAFQAETSGSATIEELKPFQNRIVEIPRKQGINAFTNTRLGQLLKQRKITQVILAGAITSICIDSTGRSAYAKGYQVIILSDCTSARTDLEQGFYCSSIFPLYADVITHTELLNRLACYSTVSPEPCGAAS